MDLRMTLYTLIQGTGFLSEKKNFFLLFQAYLIRNWKYLTIFTTATGILLYLTLL